MPSVNENLTSLFRRMSIFCNQQISMYLVFISYRWIWIGFVNSMIDLQSSNKKRDDKNEIKSK